jgi:hypothetical protein
MSVYFNKTTQHYLANLLSVFSGEKFYYEEALTEIEMSSISLDTVCHIKFELNLYSGKLVTASIHCKYLSQMNGYLEC